ncbi:MAG: IS701 family transposase [Desulfobacterales bacterium]|nr:IS701 family transposase [Desulfobacterales bacterium]
METENIQEKTEERADNQAESPLAGLAHDFVHFISRYNDHFTTKTRSVVTQAKQYLCGLVQAEKKNMERMEEVVPGSDGQSLQHFIANSPWSDRDVTDRVASDADSFFGDDPDTCMIIDESGLVKKGDKSVGVRRQWCGQLGKRENCQVGVYGALSCREHVTLTDTRLYLPKIWADDKERCNKAGIPDEHIVYKKKTELAAEIVSHARSNNVRFSWVGADAFYGNDPEFLRTLNTAGEIFVADVHKNQRIYMDDPEPAVPEPKSEKGRKPSRPVAQSISCRVDKWAESQPESGWQRMVIRDGTKGGVEADILHGLVWLWDGEEEKAHCRHLTVRREADSPDKIKYSLSNAPEDTSPGRLAFMQGQRYWVERSLQDAKNECGLDHYQVRTWRGWHHHMALVMMAMLFMLETRLSNEDVYPLLSCSDIHSLLKHFLPRRDVTVEEVLRQMEKRHRKRQSSIDSALRMQVKQSAEAENNKFRTILRIKFQLNEIIDFFKFIGVALCNVTK